MRKALLNHLAWSCSLHKKGVGRFGYFKGVKKFSIFSALLPGPMATMIFADLGADVIHVESSKKG
ncbi:CoA transferase [Lysinibacillus sp. MHQ-1]|nr:CoA transferase [Lysinibacillus sp. MHQ-1]